MSANKYREHVHVLPEDDANRQLAVGFLNHPSVDSRKIQLLPPAGGWAAARDALYGVHADALNKYPKRHLLLLVDFDQRADRAIKVLGELSDDVAARVFIFGVGSEPERLRATLGRSLERLGEDIAEDCHAGTAGVLSHELLRHNQDEIARMRSVLKPLVMT